MFWIVFFAFIGISTTIYLLIIAGVEIKESEYFDEHRFEFYCIAFLIFISLTLTITLGKPIAEKIFEKEMQERWRIWDKGVVRGWIKN